MTSGIDLTDDQVQRLDGTLGQLRLGHCPIHPNSTKQELFLLTDQLEVFFGGAAGSAKTWSLMMGALQYADVPGYRALLLRPALTEFAVSGLMDLAQEWLAGTKARWAGDTRTWRWPGGSSLTFGFLSNVADLARYKGSQFHYVGLDELTGFDERLYRGMFRVLRKPRVAEAAAPDGTTLLEVPLRMRSASNPGGPGHSWVKTRFIDEDSRDPDAIFIPAKITDNPDMNIEEYMLSLAHLPPSDRQRLINGDWDVTDEGELFQYEWFDIVDDWPEGVRSVRYWDLAGTEPSTANSDPDFTVGLRLEIDRERNFIVRHLIRGRWSPGKVQAVVAQTAALDGRSVPIVIEQDPGQAGVDQVDRYKRDTLRGFIVKSVRPTGPKEVRAQSVAAAAENKLVKVVRGPHTQDFLDELCCAAGTRVVTKSGLRPVEAILPGVEVLTHRGRFRPVTGVMHRRASTVRVEAKTLAPLVLTPNHPALSMRIGNPPKAHGVEWKPIEAFDPRRFSPSSRGPDEPRPNPHDALVLPFLSSGGENQELDIGALISLPSHRAARAGGVARWWQLTESDGYLSTTHAKSGKLRRYWPLDYTMGRLFGLYLAEGCTTSGQCGWSFGEDEPNLIEEVEHAMSILGPKTFRKPSPGCITVVASSALMTQVFGPLGKAVNKHLADWMWGAPEDFWRGMAQGWAEGDGSTDKGGNWFVTTASETLAWEMRLLLVTLGERTSLRKCREEAQGALWCLDWRTGDGPSGQRLLENLEGRFAGFWLKSVEDEPVRDVYNLTVSEDESYVTTGGTLHNCAFPNGSHDDTVDALSGAHMFLAGAKVSPMRLGVARRRLPSAGEMIAAHDVMGI